MKNVFIFHGTYGAPDENWFPWLKVEMEKLGYEVIIPVFPTPEGQSLEAWQNVFVRFRDQINQESIFVGHSLGVAFMLEVLEELDYPIKAVYSVAGFVSTLGNPDFDQLNSTFVNRDFDWDKIKHHGKQFFVLQGENDPYVSLFHANEMAKELGVEVNLIEVRGILTKKLAILLFMNY